MSGRSNSALLGAAAIACLLGTTMQSQALNCARGKFVTTQCFNALNKQISDAGQLQGCLRAMEAEYSGQTGAGAGAGQRFDAKKRECKAIIGRLSGGVGLDEAGGGQAEVDSAVGAVEEWANQ
jgi:hypothetical protein